jgi:cell wall-associated NlpC family hydrolase
VTRILGEAGVAVVPITDAFRSQLDAKVRAQMAGLRPELNIGANTKQVDAAVAKIMATVKAANPAMRLQFVTTEAVAELARFEAAVRALGRPTVKFNMDMSQADRQVAVMQGYLDKLKEAIMRGAELNIDDVNALKKLGTVGAFVARLDKQLKSLKADADVAPLMAELAKARGMFEDLSKDLRNLHIGADATQLQAQIAKGIAEANILKDDLKDMAMDVDDSSMMRKFAASMTEVGTLQRQLKNMPMDGDVTPFLLKLAAARKEADAVMETMTRPVVMKLDMNPLLQGLTREEALVNALQQKLRLRTDINDQDVEDFLVKTVSQTEAMRQLLLNLRANVSDSEAKVALDDLMARVLAIQERMSNLSPHASLSNLLNDFATLENVVGKASHEFGTMDEGTKSVFRDMTGLSGAVGRFGDRVVGAGRDGTNSINMMTGAVGGFLKGMGHVTLFGGMFNNLNKYLLSFVSGWHLLADAIFEVIAVWVPATIAFAAWGAAAAPDVKNVVTQFQNMGTAVAATGQKLNNFQGATKLFGDSMQMAVRPAVWNLVGDAIQVVNARSGAFVGFLKQMNPLVESLGARATVALKNGFGNFLSNGAKMFYQLGTAIGNFLGILGNLGKVVPHYAEILLGLGTAFLKVVEDITASPLFQSIIGFGLKMHGAAVYIGVFITLLATLGRSLLGGFLQGFASARNKMQDFADSERAAAEATNNLAEATNTAGAKLKNGAEDATNLSASMSNLGQHTQEGEAALKDAGAASEDTRGKFQKLGSGLGGLVGNISNLGTKSVGTWNSMDKGASTLSRMGGFAKKAGVGALGMISSFTGLGPVGLAIGGVAAAIGIGLYFALKKSTDATQSFVNAQLSMADNATIGTFTQDMTRGISLMQLKLVATSNQMVTMARSSNVMGTVGKQDVDVWSGAWGNAKWKLIAAQAILTEFVQKTKDNPNPFAAWKTSAPQAQAQALLSSYGELSNGIAAAKEQMNQFNTHVGQAQMAIKGMTGENLNSAQVMGVATNAGISLNSMIHDQGGAWQQDLVQILGTVQGFQAMGPAIGGANTALNALNITTSSTYQEIQKVTQAYQQFIQIVTGSESAYATFAQGMNSLATAVGAPSAAAGGGAGGAGGGAAGGGTLTFANGKINSSAPVTGSSGVIGGVSSGGVAALSAYIQQIQQAETLLNSLQTQAAVSGNSPLANTATTKAGKDLVALLGSVPGVANNPAAVPSLSALAQTAGFTGNTASYQDIVKWAGSASNAQSDLTKQTNALTAATSDLNRDAAALNSTMTTQMQQSMASAILGAEGATQKFQQAARAVIAWQNAGSNLSGSNYTKLLNSLRPMAETLLRTTHSSSLAKQQLEGFLEQMGIAPGVAAKMANALLRSNAAASANAAANRSVSLSLAQVAKATQATITNVTTSRAAWVHFGESLGMSAQQANKLWGKLKENGLQNLLHQTAGTETAFQKLARQFGISKTQADALWNKFHDGSMDMLKNKANSTFSAFMKLAHQFGVTAESASMLWQRAHQQQFDMLSGKSRITVQQLQGLAHEFGLSGTQAQTLWAVMHKQYLDALAGKAGITHNQFSRLATMLDLNKTEANALWAMMRRQYLDTLTSKANVSYSAFLRLAKGFGITNTAAAQMWAQARQQQFDMLSNKSRITNSQLQKLAHQFGVSTTSASQLWSMMRQQYLDALTSKTGVSKSAFDAWARSAHISTGEANTLWNMLHQQYFDELTAKASRNRSQFDALSEAWHVSAVKADALWRVLQQQYLDQITHKATMSHQAFDTLAKKLGYSSTEADAMWNSLKRMSGNYGVHVHTNVDGGGKVGAEVTVSAAIANTMKAAGNLGSTVLKSLGLAQGGLVPSHFAGGGSVPGWGNHDSVPAMLMPGELVIPKNHAAEFASQAKRKGIPGFAGGGIVGATTSPLAGVGGLVNTQTSGNVAEMPAEGNQLATIPAKLIGEVGKLGPMVTQELVASIQAVQSAIMNSGSNAAVPGGVVAGNAMGNLMEIGKYLMSQGASAAAAAGIASVVYGESAGNPESVGSGGYGLIGWTGNSIGLPAGYHGPTGNASKDLAIQMAGLVGYGKANGPWGSLIKMTDPVAAGDMWSSVFERPAVHLSDTRPSLATQLYASLRGFKGMGPVAPGAAGVGSTPSSSAGRILSDAERYVGHPYRFGGSSNPSTGWDCSSFASWVLGHDLGLALPGGSWASTTNSGQSHGDVASMFANLPGAHPVGSNPAQIMPGDVLVWPDHVGFGVGPNKMFSAYGTNFGTIFSNAQASGGLTIMRYGAGAQFGGGSAMPGPQQDTGAFTFNFAEGGTVGNLGAGGLKGAKAALSRGAKPLTRTGHPTHKPKPKLPTEAQDIAAYNSLLKQVVHYYDQAMVLADASEKQAVTKAPTAAQKAADIAAASHLTSEADQRSAKTAKDRSLLNKANKLSAQAHAYSHTESERRNLLALANNDAFAANHASIKPAAKKALMREAALLTTEANRPKYGKGQKDRLLHEAAVDRSKVSYSHTGAQRKTLLAEAARDRAATHTKNGSLAQAEHYLALAAAADKKMAALDHKDNGRLSKLIAPSKLKTLVADAQELADLGLLGDDPLLRTMRSYTGVISSPKLKNAMKTASGSVHSDVVARAAAASSAASPIKGVNTGLGQNVTRWAPDVSKVLAMEGLPQSLLNQVLYQISTESSGNPTAINLWDSNAKAGHPSQGLLQTIPSTFKAFHWPGTSNNIDDPMANIAAAVNYAKHTYGDRLMTNGTGLGSGRGYALGGIIPEPVFGVGASGRRYSFGERGPERILPGTTPNGGGAGGPGMTTYQANTMLQLLGQLVTINRQQPQQLAQAQSRGSGHSAMSGFTQLGR